MSNRSPLAVVRPSNASPYQLAMPRSKAFRWAAIVLPGVRDSGAFPTATGTEGGTLAAGGGTKTCAWTGRVATEIRTTANRADGIPANNQIRSGAFRRTAPDLRRITIR